MKTYLHFLIEAAEQDLDQFKADVTNQMLNNDKGQGTADKNKYAADSEESPDPDVVVYMDKEKEGIQQKIEELETQKQNIQNKIQSIEDMLIDQTIDPNNEEAKKKIEDLKLRLNQDIEQFDNMIEIEQGKQEMLQDKRK